MSKTMTISFLIVGISLLFYLFGIIESNPLLDILIRPETMTTGAFYLTLIGGLVVGIGAIVVGAITKNIELSVMTPITAYLITLLWNFIQVYNQVKSQNEVLALIIFAPAMFMMIIIMVDYWRGRD